MVSVLCFTEVILEIEPVGISGTNQRREWREGGKEGIPDYATAPDTASPSSPQISCR